MEEETPGLFEQKDDDELLDADVGDEFAEAGVTGGMSQSEDRAAELLGRLNTERTVLLAAVAEHEAATDEVGQAQHEMQRIQAALAVRPLPPRRPPRRAPA